MRGEKGVESGGIEMNTGVRARQGKDWRCHGREPYEVTR